MNKDEVKAQLSTGWCDIVYLKKNGETRLAVGTTDPTLCPAPVGLTERKYNEQQIRYYDKNVSAWRSFLLENLQEIKEHADGNKDQ